MKTTTLIIALFSLFGFFANAQHDHQMDNLFNSKTLAQFETDLELNASQLNNQVLIEFVDSIYQGFFQNIQSRMNGGETIDEIQLTLEYNDMVLQTRGEIGNPHGGPNAPPTPKALNGPCENMDFESGDFTGWTLTRGNVDGSVPYSYVGEVLVGPGAYHTIFGGGVDPVCGIPRVNPTGGAFSARIGNGTGTGARGARVRQSFLVDATNYMYRYSYAVVFESPNGHTLNELPYFTVRVFDELGASIFCGEYSVIADAANTPDYETTNYMGSTVLYKDWSTVFTNLQAYIGQNVTVEFTAGDCSLGGHFGYAYVDASCGIDSITASNDLICAGDSALLTAPGGVGSYLWNTGETSQSIWVYSGGVYSCELVPFQGPACGITLDITINENPSPTADFNFGVAGCVGTPFDFNDLSTIPNPGAITGWRWDFGDGVVTPISSGPIVAVPNTTGTYTAPSHTYAAGGVYNVELYVETADGCTDSITVPVTINSLPVVAAGPDQVVCNGTLVTLTGAGAVNYAWDNGVTNGVPFLSPLGLTTYTVIGTDANGCQNTDQVNVTVNPLPNVGAGADQEVCAGTAVTLSGSGAVNYAWDNGITNGVPFVQAVGTITYTVTGTDANGCQNTDQVDVTVNPLPVVGAGADVQVCLGTAVTLNGSGAVNYAWNNGVTNGVPFVPGVGTITYTVTGTDANGCQNTDQVDVTVWPLPVVAAGPDQVVCNGTLVTLTGAGAVNYAWDNGVTNGVPFLSPLGLTTYTVIGTDANGCQNTDQVNVTVNPLPHVGAGVDQVVCAGTAVTLSGSGAVNYAWDNGVIDGVPFVPAVGTITYTVTGTDANGCQNTDQVDVTVNPLPLVGAGADQVVCDGTAVTLSGSGAVNYAWDNGITDGVPFVQVVGPMTYTVTGTDANGCQNTDQVDVTVNPLPNVGAGADQAVCDGAAVTLNGSGAVNYAWDNGITDGVPFVQAVGTITYTVTGTDANGCQNTDQVDVTVNPLPIVGAGADQVVCEGTAVTLSGSGAVNYAWDNGVIDGVPFVPAVGTITYTVTGTDANGCQNTDQVDVTVNPLPIVGAGADQVVCDGVAVTLNGSGAVNYAWDNGITDGVPFVQAVGTITYTVTGTDANGCQNTDQVNVTVNPLPVVGAGLDQVVCQGTAVTLSGSGAVNYAWDNGITDGVPFVQGVGTMTYTVTGTDANGCQNTDQVDVTVYVLPNVGAGLDKEVCAGTAVTLSGSGAVNYAWDNGVIDGVPFVPAVGTITYTVTGTDANGCQNTDQVDVTVNPLPLVGAGADQVVCDGVAVTLSGSGAVNYAWDNGITNGVPFVQAVGTTTYTVIGTDANGCQNTDQVDVTVNALPNVGAGADQTVCDGVAVTLNGSGAVNYAWDNGITNGVPFVQAVGTMTYTVTGTDANGCQNTDQVDVTVNPLPIVGAGANQVTCAGTAVTLSGSGAINYLWNNGIADGVPFVQAVGTMTYTVTGTDANGCQNTDQVDVTVNPLPNVSANDAEICEGESVTLAGSGAINYVWNNGVIDNVAFTPTSSGEYTVTGTDANGCSNSATVFVTVNQGPNAAFTILNLHLTTVDATTGFNNLTTGAVSYEWNFGDGSGISNQFEPVHTFPEDAPGEYEITLTAYSAEGCPSTAIKYVHVFQDYTIYVPNAFTPDGNGNNEIFKPVMEGFDEDEYTLYIFNRWGELVFESHDMQVGWDGKYAGQNFETQDGVFTWKIIAGIKDSADTKIFVGHASILK